MKNTDVRKIFCSVSVSTFNCISQQKIVSTNRSHVNFLFVQNNYKLFTIREKFLIKKSKIIKPIFNFNNISLTLIYYLKNKVKRSTYKIHLKNKILLKVIC